MRSSAPSTVARQINATQMVLAACPDAAGMTRPRSDADVVVVGGGCRGASSAWPPAKAGADVILLERAHVGAGATGHSGALVRRHYEPPAGIRLANERWQVFTSFARHTGR